MDPKNYRLAHAAKFFLAALFIGIFSQQGFAGVVQMNAADCERRTAPPADEPIVLASAASADVTMQYLPDHSGEKLATLNDEHSEWLALLSEPSTSAHAKSAAVAAQDRPHMAIVTDSTPPATAVIPLPPAVWSGLMTLGAAGIFAVRSRSGRRL